MNSNSYVAVVTGGAKGIGKAICERLFKDGYKIAICCNSSTEKANIVADKINQNGGFAKVYAFDITDSKKVSDTAKLIEREMGPISVLVNNAGIAKQILFDTISDDEWHKMIETNLSGTFYFTRSIIPFMIHRKQGKIINIASMWGETGGSCEVHYSASKAGIIGMTKALAKEVGPSGITVNCISPGVVLTDMTSHFDKETMDELKEETPLNRIGTPEDIAGVVSFLASKDADFITGQDIGVNGGIVI